MLDKLKEYKKKYDKLALEVIKIEVINDNKLYRKLMKEYTSYDFSSLV